MADLPWDIIIDILSRVPVKDLLRYRSVAKPWRSLIDSQDFIKHHLSHSIETTTNLAVLLENTNGFLSFSLDTPSKGPLPLALPEDKLEIIASLDGLFVVMDSSESLALWNPTTRRYEKIPCTGKNNLPMQNFCAIGLGYDPAADDYMLLRATHYCDNMIFSDGTIFAEVYSVKSGSWSSVAGFPTGYYLLADAGVSLGSSLNWIAFSGKSSEEGDTSCDGSFRVVAFDFTSKKFTELPLPNTIKGHINCYISLLELNGCLSLRWNSNPSQEFPENLEVWVMKEYGFGDSWSKIFSILPSGSIGNFFYAVPFAYLRGMDRFLINDAYKGFVMYDLEKKTEEGLTITRLPVNFGYVHCCYVQSLVGIGKGKGSKA